MSERPGQVEPDAGRLAVIGEALALVGHVDHEPPAGAPDAERDRAPAVAVSVVDQDVDDLADDLLGRARDGRAGLYAAAQWSGVSGEDAAPTRLGRAERHAQVDARVAAAR